MTFEEKLDKLIALLEKSFAAAPAATAPAPARTTRAAPAAPKKEPGKTLDDLKVVLKKVLDDKKRGGKDVAIAILGKFDASKLGELKEEQYDEVFKYCEDTLSGDVDPMQDSDDDGGGELM